MTIPPGNWVYEARLLSQRCFEFPDRRVFEWVGFFRHLWAEIISWRCPWLDLPPMTVHSIGPQWVVLAGLEAFTFYIPYRIQCQLDLRQKALSEVLADIVMPSKWPLQRFLHILSCQTFATLSSATISTIGEHERLPMQALIRPCYCARVTRNG